MARSVDISPDGRHIVLGFQDTTVGVWQLASGARQAIGRGHRNAVTGVVFSPDGDRIASVSLDRTLRIWDAEALKPLAAR